MDLLTPEQPHRREVLVENPVVTAHLCEQLSSGLHARVVFTVSHRVYFLPLFPYATTCIELGIVRSYDSRA